MRIPQEVRVLGKIYTVRIGAHDLELSRKALWGEADHTKLVIDLRGDLSHPQQEETLLHELMHAVENGIIHDTVPEAHIYALSAGLFAVMKDNGWWPGES